MTRERFEQIKAAALRMAGEIEWAELVGAEQFTPLLNHLIAQSLLPALIRGFLGKVFQLGDWEYIAMRDVQEVEQQGAALVQAGLKYALLTSPEISPHQHSLRGLPLRTKFKGIAVVFEQAPPNVRVPSMRTQRRRIERGEPPVDGLGQPDTGVREVDRG